MLPGVLLHVIKPSERIDYAPHFISRLDVLHVSRIDVVDNLSVFGFLDLLHARRALLAVQAARVEHLSAACRIKRRLVKSNRGLVTRGDRLNGPLELMQEGIGVVQTLGHANSSERSNDSAYLALLWRCHPGACRGRSLPHIFGDHVY